jgi:hypothetical protein
MVRVLGPAVAGTARKVECVALGVADGTTAH